MKLHALFVLAACSAPAPRPVTNETPQARVPRLTPEEVAAISKEIQAALPPVDQEAATACTAIVDVANLDPDKAGHARGEAAACLRAAGGLGAAIQIWRMLAHEDVSTDWARTARRELGPAYEAAGLFAEAADAYAAYAREVPAEHGRLARAACLWRQLGDDDKAAAAEKELGPSPACTSIRRLRPQSR